MDTNPPGACRPLLVVMSMMPAVSSPYSAGNAPVTRLIEEIRRGSRVCPNTAMPSGQNHAVDAVLQARVLAAHVVLPEGVLDDVGRLQYHLVEQRVGTARRGGDGLGIDRVRGGAGLGLDVRALFVEMLRGHHDGGQRRVRTRGCFGARGRLGGGGSRISGYRRRSLGRNRCAASRQGRPAHEQHRDRAGRRWRE